MVSCLQRSQSGEANAEDALCLCRAGKRQLAEKVVLCLSCKASASLQAYAEHSAVPMRLISRETMLALAGMAHPATDAQLVDLGRRKKSPGAAGRLRSTVLHRDRAGRYMFYGTAMLMIYILTGAGGYPLPGLLLLGLGACCRYGARREEGL